MFNIHHTLFAFLAIIALTSNGLLCASTHDVEHLEAREIRPRAPLNYGGAYPGSTKCDTSDGHCLYIANGYTWGVRGGPAIVCEKADASGSGYPTCQFSASATTRARCYGDPKSYVEVHFGQSYSQFTAIGNAVAVFSSQRGSLNGKVPGTQWGQSSEPGDDVYVTCGFRAPEFGGVYAGAPKCNQANGHCVFMTNLFTYGARNSGAIVCRRTDDMHRGLGACQLPVRSTTRLFCLNDATSYVEVTFTKHQSSFNAVGKAWAQFSSARRNGNAPNAKSGSSNEPGDDVHATCDN